MFVTKIRILSACAATFYSFSLTKIIMINANGKVTEKVVLVWVDGATFDVIAPLLKKELPTFRRIMREGVNGTLISTIPPCTPPAWASLVTGVNPGKHGVYDFWDRKGDKPVPVTSYSIHRETLWSMLNEVGKKVILLNAPMTYPPRRLKGILVTGFMTPSNVPYTYPPNFKGQLLREFPDYLIDPRTCPPPLGPASDEHISCLEESFNLLRKRREVTLYLMENFDWDLLISVFHCTDSIQHYFWKYMDPTHPAYDPDAPKTLKEAIPKAYKIVDNSIREILKAIDEDTTLIVMSDHGFGPIHKCVFLNNYLRTLDLLSISMEGVMMPIVIDRFLKFLKTQLPHVSKFILGAAKTIFHRIRATVENMPSLRFSDFIDWTQTKAYSLSALGDLSVNRSVVKSSQEYEELIEYLIQKLFELADPEDNEKIVDNVFRKQQIYSGRYLEKAPDLFLVIRKMQYMTTSSFVGNQIVGPSPGYSGSHRMEGILFMYGKNLRRGQTLRSCNIRDLMPTILYMLSVRFPSDIDGKVLLEAFQPSYVKTHLVEAKEKARTIKAQKRYALSESDEQRIKERLKALGYL